MAVIPAVANIINNNNLSDRRRRLSVTRINFKNLTAKFTATLSFFKVGDNERDNEMCEAMRMSDRSDQ